MFASHIFEVIHGVNVPFFLFHVAQLLQLEMYYKKFLTGCATGLYDLKRRH